MIKLDDKGLVPAIIQDDKTGDVLMLGYASPGSLARTFREGDLWLYSRSRAELWHKGALSGNYMYVRSISTDCDKDALLIKVDPDGPICHTGERSCFFNVLSEMPKYVKPEKGSGILEELFATIQDRKDVDPNGSYTAKLLSEGVEYIAQKVIEEAGETAIEGIKSSNDSLASEAADLFYHVLVLIAATNLTPEDIWEELRQRRK